jgi:hypothetical protein
VGFHFDPSGSFLKFVLTTSSRNRTGNWKSGWRHWKHCPRRCKRVPGINKRLTSIQKLLTRLNRYVPSHWIKIKNHRYSEAEGREELFDRSLR